MNRRHGLHEFGDGEIGNILEWLGREHGANAVELLCSELTDEGDSAVRREGAGLGLGRALSAIVGMLRATAEQDDNPGLRATCAGILANLSDETATPIGDPCPHTGKPCIDYCNRGPGGCLHGVPYPGDRLKGSDHG